MVGNGQSTSKLWWAVVQGKLANREEVDPTFALLLDELFLQILHEVAMVPLD